MPGPYAHLTLINELVKSSLFDRIIQPSGDTQREQMIGCCMLGAVSPDLPNLASPESGNSVWADVSHCGGSGAMIANGIELLRDMPADESRKRCLAWMLGYSSHVVADALIHPVVQIKVGIYEQNVFAHRLCELHQDHHVAPLLGLGEIGSSPYLNSLLQGCSHHTYRFMLNSDISVFWHVLLRLSYAGLFQEQSPDIDSWYRNALRMVEAGEEEGYHLFPLARSILAKTGLTYPGPGSGDADFTGNLQVPGGERMDYAEIFTRTLSLTADAWKVVSDGVHRGDDRYRDCFGDWNLDTGCGADGRFALW